MQKYYKISLISHSSRFKSRFYDYLTLQASLYCSDFYFRGCFVMPRFFNFRLRHASHKILIFTKQHKFHKLPIATKNTAPIHDSPTHPITISITEHCCLLATFQSTAGCVNRTQHHPSLNHTRSNRDRLAVQHGSISHRSTISSDKSQHRRTILNKKFGMVARVRWFEYLCGRGGGSIFPPDFTRCRTISKRSIPPNTTQ